MKKNRSHSKPGMTSPTALTTTTTSVSAIITTTAATNNSSLPLDNNNDIIITKIENATEGLPLAALTIFLREYFLHLDKMLLLYVITYLL